MMKYLWRLLFGLGFIGAQLPCAQWLNVVMATDRNYVIPTAVAMKSLIEAEKNSEIQLRFIIFVDKAAEENQPEWRELYEPLLTQMKQVNPEHVEVKLLDITHFKDPLLTAATEKYHNKLIALRLVFPKIWEDQKLPGASAELFAGVRSFLWLDSDVLVMQSLKPLLTEVGYGTGTRKKQPIISANLDFIRSEHDDKVAYHKYEIWSYSGHFPPGDVGLSDAPGSARVSGGVVLWSLDDMPEVEDLELGFPRGRLRRQGNFDTSVLTCCFYVTIQSTEESVFDTLLRQSQKQIYFFSTTYNCRPGYIPVAQNFLNPFESLEVAIGSKELSYVKGTERQKTFETLQQIAEQNVAIWHWDYSANTVTPQERSQIPQGVLPELKPWCVRTAADKSPEALWRQKYKEVKQSFEDNTEITQLFTAWEAQNFKG